MFADMLNAPIAELTVSNYINAVQDFINARTLVKIMRQYCTTTYETPGRCS